jgi:iron complex transport system substrate-binding protein
MAAPRPSALVFAAAPPVPFLPGALILAALFLAGALGLAAAPAPSRADAGETPALARRVVSMNPSLSSILVSLDAASVLVGIEEHSARLHPELAGVPVVGGLFNPSLEGVLAVEPDLVVLVPSAEQRDFRGRLEALGIEVLVLPNITVEQILTSIEVLGARVGRVEAARVRAAEIRRRFAAVARAAEERPPVRAVVVLQRDPLYVVGAGSFIDEILRTAGAVNVAGELPDPYPRAAVEWLIAAAPDVILDASDEPPDAAEFWLRWPSIPAVRAGTAVALPRTATFPGPYLDRSLQSIVERLPAAAASGGHGQSAAGTP